MNVKKYLKKRTQQNLQALETESDREFLARLQSSAEQAPKPKRNKNWLWAIPSSVAVCAAVLVGTLVPLSGGGSNDIKYKEKNFVRVDSDLTTLFGALNGLTVRITEGQTVTVKKTYDSLSGDDLFYTMNIEEISDSAFYKLGAVIVVNDKYEFDDFNVTEDFLNETFSNYSVKYSQEVTFKSDMGLNLVQCNAKIENSDYDIYVTDYEEYSLDNGTFLTVIGNLFEFNR